VRAGDVATARRALAEAQRLRPRMTHAVPVISVICLLEMCRAYQELDEPNAIKTLLFQATDILRHRPALVELADEVTALRRANDGTHPAAQGWEATLTAAELRLLPFLTTHLTFREIGDRLFLSRNTVKTQAISVYRKLGASSRSEAVQRATELGLVEAHMPDALIPSG
jgi:LuxR family maltose regulon positive regulatory protein